jgi:hypothetical protein
MRYVAAILGALALLAAPARADPAHPYPGARGTKLTGGRQATIALTVKRSLLRRVGSRSDRRRRRHPARLEIRMTAGTVDTRSQTVTFRS